MKTLLIGEIHPDAEHLLSNRTNLLKISNDHFQNYLETSEKGKEVEATVLRTFTQLQKETIEKLPSLKYVVSCSVGINNIDLKELQKRNIELIHGSGSNANSVAEHTLYLILSLLRNSSPIAELKGKTIGIVGLGHIGKVVAKKLLGFGCRIITYDVIKQDPQVLKELKVGMKSFKEVMKSDIVTVHVPLNEYTKHLIDERKFSLLKQGAFFINTSRAEVIDEDSLIRYKDKLRGIALDVCSEDFFLEHPNLIVTNHCAAQGEDSFREQCLQPVKVLIEKITQKQ